MNRVRLINADVRAGLAMLPDNYFDSCVCDPPYEQNFMGKKWDSTGISYSVEMWREVWRVLKPGAYLLAFGGSRTYHRLACAIEDAGFILHPMIGWIFGSGFPKATNVGKAIDKAAGAEREENIVPTKKGNAIRLGQGNQGATYGDSYGGFRDLSAPATPLARQWEGWFYGRQSLKPALEPICMAQKPPEGRMLDNLLKWGTGAVNIHRCMIDVGKPWERKGMSDDLRGAGFKENRGKRIDLGTKTSHKNGRWPANVIHDGSEEVLACFPDSKGQQGDVRGTEQSHTGGEGTACYGEYGRVPAGKRDDNGSAARFFYAAKASSAERNLGCERMDKKPAFDNPNGNMGGNMGSGSGPRSNHHPTVKPLALMSYLVRLVTPPGGVVLDCFSGSGSTLIAAAKEGFDAVGIDLEREYLDIAERRLRGHLGYLVEVSIETP